MTLDLTAYQECVTAFAAHDYKACVKKALPLLESHADLHLLQLVLIGLQRLGEEELSAQVGADALRSCRGQPWELVLLELSLGRREWSEAMEQAGTAAQRCQTYYYAGARALTLGQREQALAHFRASRAITADCLERELAGNEGKFLAPAGSRFLDDDNDVEEVRIEHDSIVGRVQITRPKGTPPILLSKPEAHLGGWLAPPSLEQTAADLPGATYAESPTPALLLDWEQHAASRKASMRVRDLEVLPRRIRSADRGLRDTVRVFISSTFRDMQAEREVLVKKIFPRLKALCAERGLDFIEVDLRWGITEERHGEVLSICLAEIDACQYFVALLGARYGWVPDALPEVLLREQPWLRQFADRSVTELEIRHRLQRQPESAPCSFFYVRAPAAESAAADGGLGEPPLAMEALALLKNALLRTSQPVRENYPTADAVGEQIYQDLAEAIIRDHPCEEEQDPAERERAGHEVFAAGHLRGYVPRLATRARLYGYVADSETEKPIVFVGPVGVGKSALLADWVLHHREQHPGDVIIAHYTTATPVGTSLSALLRRLMAEIRMRYPVDPHVAHFYQVPEDEDAGQLLNAFGNHLNLVMRLPEQRFVLVLDGLDHLEDGANLSWLPGTLFRNTKIILSTRSGPVADAARARGWAIEPLEPFSPDEVARAASDYLRPYGKELGQRHLHRLAQAPQARQPLYLRVILNELRVFGSYEGLDGCMARHLEATDLLGLYLRILARWQEDHDRERPGMVCDILCWLRLARRGLAESECLALLGIGHAPPVPSVWSPFFLALRFHLVSRSGLLVLGDEGLARAVDEAFSLTDEARQRRHVQLADFFARRDLDHRKMEALPWHLQQAGEWERLKDCLADLDLVERLRLEGGAGDLLRYWQALAGRFDIVEVYEEALHRAHAAGLDEDRLGVHVIHLAGLLRNAGRFDDADWYYRQGLASCAKEVGVDHPSTALVQTELASLLVHQGKVVEAEALQRQALHIQERALGPLHFSLAVSLLALGEIHEARQEWDRAERCYERALEIREVVSGFLHPAAAGCASHLGVLALRRGDQQRAERFCKQALHISEQLGTAEQDAAAWRALDALAELRRQQERYAEAEGLYRIILARRRRTVGSENPWTGLTLGRLGLVRLLQGHREEGASLCREALAICIRSGGRDHPATLENARIVGALSGGESTPHE